VKRIIFLIIAVLLFAGIQFLVNCSNPLEDVNGSNPSPPGPIVEIDTLYIIDTVFDGDTVLVIDTTIVIDTLVVADTVVVIDTAIVIDTLVVADTVVVIDTTIVIDTLVVADTVVVIDTNTVFDTVFINDTVFVVDTTVIIDTVIVVEPGPSNVVCATISTNQPEIVWMLRYDPGTYLLEFDASLESDHPAQSLTVDIDGREYQWTPAENPELILETDLEEQTLIRIVPLKPPSLGHSVHICLNITELEE